MKAKSVTVTARNQSETPRSATAKSILTVETKTKTGTKTRKEAAAMWSNCLTGATVKTVRVAVSMHHLFAGTAGTRVVAALNPFH